MKLVGHHVVINITGTKKSMILDRDELQKIEFSKDEKLRDDFQDVNDLIEHALNTAFMSGDAIFSVTVDGVDVVESLVKRVLSECGNDLDGSLPEICALPFLSNADPSDVYEYLMEISAG